MYSGPHIHVFFINFPFSPRFIWWPSCWYVVLLWLRGSVRTTFEYVIQHFPGRNRAWCANWPATSWYVNQTLPQCQFRFHRKILSCYCKKLAITFNVTCKCNVLRLLHTFNSPSEIANYKYIKGFHHMGISVFYYYFMPPMCIAFFITVLSFGLRYTDVSLSCFRRDI